MSPQAANPTGPTLAAGVSDPLFQVDTQAVITRANPAAVALLSRHADPVVGALAQKLFPDAFGATFNRELARALRFGLVVRFEEQYLPEQTWLEVHIYPDVNGATVLIHDAADRRRDADLVEDHARVLEQIARGRTLQAVLEAITGLVERHGNGLLAAVFAADEPAARRGGMLRAIVGPSLPLDYLQTGESIEVRPDGSPIGQAAFTLKTVVISDLFSEPCDPKFRESALRHGLRACWAVPIISTGGARLGVLGIYRREPGAPADWQRRLLQTAANLAGIALERQLKEADLRQKQEEYRAIVETVQDAMIVTDTHGYIVEVNPATSRIHGGSYDSFIGRQAMDLIRPDYHGVIRRLLDEVRQGREYQAEIVCIRKDGSSFPAEVNAGSIVYKGQRHVLAVVRDASYRKKMEDSLRKTEERLRTVANGAPLILFSLDQAGVFTLSEGQALASIGLRPGEVVGRNALELYAYDPAIVQHLKQALAGEPQRFTSEVSERVFDTIVRPLRSHRGEIVGAVGVAIDTTEQTLTEEALAESEDRFRASFHQAPIGSAHMSLDGTVLRANEPLATMLGTTPQAIVGRKVREWFADEADRAQHAEIMAHLLTMPMPAEPAIRTMRSEDGRTFPAVVSLSVVRGRRGEPKHLVCTVTPMPR